ncbi:hypothetical protein AGOR_G00018790 [Albula goreensis]|uniref:Uncharacterized protein n=1 Tax=Albula goreensis TaxID=1534307 RepID=A0A8T3E4Y9_9TELE|nr:hypothetical protein AGOR_G00018790 [Albula goreensis]
MTMKSTAHLCHLVPRLVPGHIGPAKSADSKTATSTYERATAKTSGVRPRWQKAHSLMMSQTRGHSLSTTLC